MVLFCKNMSKSFKWYSNISGTGSRIKKSTI